MTKYRSGTMNRLCPPSRRTVLKFMATAMGGASLATGGAAANERTGQLSAEKTNWGEPVQMGDGEVRTYITRRADGRTHAVGLHFTADAWKGLPSSEKEGHSHFALDLPTGGDETPFSWVGVNWAAEGYPPQAVYDVPHLDLQFYMMDQDSVYAISPDDEYQVPLAEDQHPTGYVRTNEVVLERGEHLIDPSVPEFKGEVFTQTFIWGAYDGNLTFYEPMITIEYLEQLTDYTRAAITLPEAFAEAGDYPTWYTVQYRPEQDAYTVELDCFSEFQASREILDEGEEVIREFDYMFRVEDMTGEPITEATVEAHGGSATATEMGTATLTLPEGEHDVVARAEGFDSTTQMVVVEGKQMQTMPLVLEED